MTGISGIIEAPEPYRTKQKENMFGGINGLTICCISIINGQCSIDIVIELCFMVRHVIIVRVRHNTGNS